MALVFEDGSGVADAESLTSVAFADDYALRFGATAWALLTVGQKEVALRKATAYLQSVYFGRWAGYRSYQHQALDFPRAYVPKERSLVDDDSILSPTGDTAFYPSNEVPNEVQSATAELAIKSLIADLLPDFDRLPRRETVGPLTVEYESNKSPVTTYPQIERMLSRFFASGSTGYNSASVRLVRA